jgi:hypothetical protein
MPSTADCGSNGGDVAQGGAAGARGVSVKETAVGAPVSVYGPRVDQA